MLLNVVDVLLVVEPTRGSSMSELAAHTQHSCCRGRRSRLSPSFVVVLVASVHVLSLAGVVVVAPNGTFSF